MNDLYDIPSDSPVVDEAAAADVTTVLKDDPHNDLFGGTSPSTPGTFGQHFESAFRSGLVGAGEQKAITNTLRGTGQKTGRQRMRETAAKIGGADAPQYPDIDQAKEKVAAARRKALEDAVYESMSIGQGGWAGAAGTAVGMLAQPENLIGIQGLIARRIPMLAADTVAASAGRAALEGAALNPAIDLVQQAAQMEAGAQPAFDLPRFALSPVVGAAAGGVIGGGTAAIGKGIASAFPGPRAETPGAAAEARKALDPNTYSNDAANVQPQTIQDVVEAPKAPQAATVADVSPIPDRPAPAAPVAREAPAVRESADSPITPPMERPVVQLETLIGAELPSLPPHRVTTAAGSQIDVAPIVVEAASLRTSADAGYNAAIQPRNRDRAASDVQIRDIATNLDPDRLGFSAEADRGAPIVGPDGMVESGNGRVMAIRSAYSAGGEKAGAYRDWITRQGVDVSGFKEPVVVRQRVTELTPEQRQKFAVEANQSATLSMSATERAKADAGNISTESLDLIRNPDNLGAGANIDFVKAFVRTLPQSEQGAVMDPRGGISSEGMTRVRNAILAKAYGDEGVLSRIAESTNDEVKSISNALVAAAPDWAKLRADIEAGVVRADMDATPDLMEAIRRVAEIRSKGQKIETALSQQDAFSQIATPVEAWMRSFYNGNRAASAKVITEQLRIFAREASKVSDNALDLGLPPVRQEDIQLVAIQKAREDGGTGTQDLFNGNGSGNGPDAGAIGTEARGRGIGEGGQEAGSQGQGRGGEGQGPAWQDELANAQDTGQPAKSLEQLFAESKKQVDDAEALVLSAITENKDRPKLIAKKDGKSIVLSSGFGDTPYRITYFDKDGPSGHVDYFASDTRSIAQEFARALRNGYEVSGRAKDTGQPASAQADMAARGRKAATAQPGDIGDQLFKRRAPGDVLPDQINQGRPVAQGVTPPADTRVQSVQNISRELVDSLGAIARLGRTPQGTLGVYKIGSGVVRVKNYGDLDTLVHELGHQLHIGGPVKAEIDALIRRNTAELSTYGAGKDATGDVESFANLFSAYVLNRPFAERTMPNATAELDRLITSNFPKEAAIIEKTRADLEALHLAPSNTVVTAETISAPPPKFTDKFKEFTGKDTDPFGRTTYSVFDALYTGFVDTAHPIYKAQQGLVKIAEMNGKTISANPIDDTYIQLRLLPGAHGSADTMLKHGVIDAAGILPEGPSLATGIEKALGKKQTDEGLNNFGAYLISRRMVQEYQRFLNGELERPPGNLSLADYQRAVQELETENPNFRAGAEDVYEFQNRFLKRMMDKGMVSRDLYDTLIQRADYVPLMRDMRDFIENEVGQAKTGTSQGLLMSSTIRKFGGSDRMVVNPLESIMKRVHDIEHAIKLNDAVGSLARLADEAGPGSGAIAEAIPNNQLRGQGVDVIDALRAAGKQAGHHPDDINALIQQAEDLLGDSTWTTLFRQEPIQPGKEPIVYHWVNGERRALRLADKRLGREMYHAMTALSDYEKNIFIQTLSLSQAILRSGVTRSLDFIAVNLVRDQITATLTAGRKYLPFYSAAKGLIDALKKGDDSLEFAGGGGMGGGAIVEAIEASQWGRNVKGLQKQGVAKSLMKSFELSETGTRVGLYKSYFAQAKELGMDDQNASVWGVFKSNDYIDFRRHGSYMGVMRRVIPFLNAAVQGTDREFRAAFDIVPLERKRASGAKLTAMELDRLKDARVALVRLTLLGIVGGSGVALMNSENEKYKDARKYNKDMNFLIPWMGDHFKIPKGFGIVQSVTNLFERGTELAMRGDPTLATDWLSAAGQAFAPPTNNPLVATFYDTTANWNRFQEREIVPFYLKGVSPEYQYGPYTSDFAKKLGKLTGSSPLKIEYALNNTFGLLSRDFLFHWDNMMASDRPEKQIYDYPIVRRFYANLDRGSQARKAFYDLVGQQNGRLEQKENAYRHLVNTGQRGEAADFLGQMKADERIWTAINTSGMRTEVKKMHPLYRAREYINITNGITRQLAVNNVIKDADVDRRNIVISRRDAQPIVLDPTQRAQAMEALQSLSVSIARNSMVSMQAKGTTGLGLRDTQKYVDQVRLISPDLAKELDYRIGKKDLPDDKTVNALWPEIQRRILRDGEKAWFDDIVPKRRRSRRR